MGRGLSLNNLSLSWHDTAIPKAERVAQARQSAREKRLKYRIAARQKAIWIMVDQQATDIQKLLSFFPTGTRIFLTDEGCGWWEILWLYEVLWIEEWRIELRHIFSEDGSGCTYPGSYTILMSISELWEQILAVDRIWQYDQKLLETAWFASVWDDITVRQNWGLITSRNFKESYHGAMLEALNTLFGWMSSFSIIWENSEGFIKIHWHKYSKAFIYNGSPAPCSIYGNAFWYSRQYNEAIELISTKFWWKKVKISFMQITYNDDGEDSIESSMLITATIWQLIRNPDSGYWYLQLNEEWQDAKRFPDDAFLTWFTISTTI